jgi:O-antigen biosynthesis protein WbqV
VLASTGSVVPLFESQIAKGGPVTVTHKDVERYFMTTQEAGALVLQAAAMNLTSHIEKGAVYVLDMGEPVNIARLARHLIRLRGFIPDRDIDIKYTGLRPGEKLTEVLIGEQEELTDTSVKGVMCFTGLVVDPESIDRRLAKLIKHIKARDYDKIRTGLADLIPDYDPNGTLSKD